MANVLMVCYGGGHMKIIEPLYHHFRQCGYVVDILALTTASPYFTEKGIPHFTYADFPELFDERAQAYGAELADALGDSGTLPKRLSESYLGVSFKYLVDEIGEMAAREQYNDIGRRAFLPTAALEHICQTHNIDLIITTNSPRSERAALHAAKNLHIPSICVNDFITINGGILDVAQNHLADRVCVLTPALKAQLVEESSFIAEHIIVSGSPVFDTLKQLSRTPSATPTILLADYQIPTQHPTLDLEYGDPEYADNVRATCNDLAIKRGWTFIFRAHPNQPLDYSAYPNVEISPSTQDLHALLRHTDIVITAVSTVGLEGIVAGAQLISLENTVFSHGGFSYQKANLSIGIDHAAELEAAIDTALTKDKHQIALYPGMATENIEVVARELLEHS